ncbi:MAG: hypothetical protein PHP10_00865 [Candidatus Omnitrophica bacterium]|nr:hypothetical protein [Candidatus Omnitrophota bacterium]
MKRHISGQSVIEYFVILTLLMVLVASSGFIDTVRNAFYDYFNRGVAYLK